MMRSPTHLLSYEEQRVMSTEHLMHSSVGEQRRASKQLTVDIYITASRPLTTTLIDSDEVKKRVAIVYCLYLGGAKLRFFVPWLSKGTVRGV